MNTCCDTLLRQKRMRRHSYKKFFFQFWCFLTFTHILPSHIILPLFARLFDKTGIIMKYFSKTIKCIPLKCWCTNGNNCNSFQGIKLIFKFSNLNTVLYKSVLTTILIPFVNLTRSGE